ncbi:penicillin amidase [Humitalea rosea]|uniref:Penicillin amidase n=1 Tax=Humitalea rosea TaxID=990373 RepID=A0A2W7IWN3_9PROT|nr:penicillin acylase family protein [Humitalea rosea]PZW51158.1 penicillin amidase [Humitalea rosea]
MRTLLGPLGKALRWLLLLVLLLALGLGGLIWATIPGQPDRLALPGMTAPVALAFDRHGIPRVMAQTEADAAMAMGWLHARDRLFQMELMRRGASGRLSELVGPGALRLDRLTRTLGLAQRAEADLDTLPPETRRLLDAYAAGVNAWISARGRLAAPEFLLSGAPDPWRPAESLLWGKVMGLWLSGDWRSDILRARLAEMLPPEALADLWPPDGGAGMPDLAAAPRLAPGRLAALLRALPDDRLPAAPLPSSASNAWAVGADRSVNRAPLLASDPHLGFQAPILWYLARIELPGGRVLQGATAPGVPFVVIGRNEHLAWGFTTTHGDVQDVFVERLVGAGAYQTPDGPRPFDTREEVIHIRGQPPEILLVRESRHGPVISDLDAQPGQDTVLAVAMANLAPGDTAAAGLHRLNQARDIAGARAAAGLISSPPQSLVVADTTGGLAMFLTGRYPIRRGGDGRLPADGASGSGDWLGWIAFDALPHVQRPNSDQIVAANDRPSPPGHPAFLGADWFGGWRAARIRALLAERGLHAPLDFAAMQTDAVSGLAQEATALLVSLPRPEGRAGVARDLLIGWDGTAAVDRAQPLIVNAFWQRFGAAALATRGLGPDVLSPSPEFVRLLLRADGHAGRWCGPAGCDALATASFEATIADLAAAHGPDPAAWRWGSVHRARFEHPILRLVPWLGALARVEVETPGDGQSINRGGYGAGFAHVHGAGLRFVADLSTPDGAWAVIATGQSGHPLSGYWSDRTAEWVAGRLDTIGK